MGEKIAFEDAKYIAEQLVEHFEISCERIEIAGSIRRRCPTVGDVELVAIPKITIHRDLLGEEIGRTNDLHRQLDSLLGGSYIKKAVDTSGRTSWGDLLRKFTVTTKFGRVVKVDLFMCDADNWGNTFLIRTGPWQFSKWCVTRKPYGPLPSGYRQRNGRMWLRGEPVPLPEEADFFALLGIDYVEPWEREGYLERVKA